MSNTEEPAVNGCDDCEPEEDVDDVECFCNSDADDSDDNDDDSDDENSSDNESQGSSHDANAHWFPLPDGPPTLERLINLLEDSDTEFLPGFEVVDVAISRDAAAADSPHLPFSSRDLERLTEAAKGNTKIKRLHLYMDYDYNHPFNISRFFKAISSLPCLESLVVCFQNLVNSNNEMVDYRPLVALLNDKITIKDLSIMHDEDYYGFATFPANAQVESLTNAMSSLTRLQSLRLTRMLFHTEENRRMVETIAGYTELRELSYLTCNCDGTMGSVHDTVPFDIHALRRTNTLESLHLQAVSVDVSALTKFVEKNKRLKSCVLIQNEYTPKHRGLGTLATTLTSHKSLSTLRINISVDALAMQRQLFFNKYATGIASNTVLKHASHVSIGDECQDLDNVLSAFTTNRTLESIYVTAFPQTKLQLSHFARLSALLRSSGTSALRSLQLRLSGDVVPDGACLELQRGLIESGLESFLFKVDGETLPEHFESIPLAATKNHSLKSLKLVHDGEELFTASQCLKLLRGLAGNKSLQELHVAVSKCICGAPSTINDQERTAVIDAMSQIYGLTECYLDAVHTDGDCRKAVDNILKLNSAGRQYMIEGESSNTKTRGIEVLSKVSENLDCIYTHVRENAYVFCTLDNNDDNSDSKEGSGGSAQCAGKKRSSLSSNGGGHTERRKKRDLF